MARRQHHRHRQLRAARPPGRRASRRAVTRTPPTAAAAGRGWKHLVAPALGLLDRLGAGRAVVQRRRRARGRSSARRIAREPWTFSPSSNLTPGTVRSPKSSRITSGCDRRRAARPSCSGMPFSSRAFSTVAHGCEPWTTYRRGGHGGEPKRVAGRWHDARRCSWSSTSATPRPTSGRSAGTSWSSTGASRPCATSTTDELGAALRNLLELRGVGLADLSASIVSSTVPQLEPEWLAMASHYLGHRMLAVGPGIRTGMPIKIDNPRELGADRLVNAVAAYERLGGPCISVDFGTAVNFDVVSAPGRVHGRRADAGRGDLARRADRRAAPSCRASTSSRRGARSARGRSTRSAPASSSGSRAPVDGLIVPASRRSWGRRRRRSPPAAWPASSCRYTTRSTPSTTC